MITIFEWLAETLGLGALKIWLASRKSTAEQLGQQEELAKIEDARILALNRTLKAEANSPTSMESLIKEQTGRNGMKYLFLALFLASCASSEGIACPDKVCPVPVTYSKADEDAQAQAEIDLKIDDNSPLAPVLKEWDRFRKACGGE